MNTQEKELKHCTACNQMTNHSGETCLKHIPDTEKNAYSRGYKQGRFDAEMDRLNKTPTPDTEWEERFDKQFSRPLTQASKNGGYEAREYIKIFIRNLLSSHTTYWKERVRKASYEVTKEFQDSLITIAIENEHLRGCVTSNQIIQAFKDFEASTHQALTNEDNLK